MRWLLGLLVLLAGCAGPTLDLDARWAPLVDVQQHASLTPLVDGESCVTLSPHVLVSDLAAWEDAFPVGVLRDAVLAHEQVHAQRQLAYPGGLWAWVARYLSDLSFMRAEELAGFRAELVYLRDHGLRVDPDAVAAALARYRGPRGGMISQADARAWVVATLGGAP